MVFVPEAAAEGLLEALFAAGAGKLGNYDRCAFTVRGEGRFRPLEGARPAIGQAPAEGAAWGADEFVRETRIEILVPEDRLEPVTRAMRAVHPYEEPAFYFIVSE